jgi:hypothetical protein
MNFERFCGMASGIKYAVEKGWLDLHESGTFVRLLTRE